MILLNLSFEPGTVACMHGLIFISQPAQGVRAPVTSLPHLRKHHGRKLCDLPVHTASENAARISTLTFPTPQPVCPS